MTNVKNRSKYGKTYTKKEALAFLLSQCERKDSCIVLQRNNISTAHWTVGKQYKCSTANRLYYFLTKNIVPESLKSTCKTKMCINHYVNRKQMKFTRTKNHKIAPNLVAREEIDALNHEYSFEDWLILSIIKSAITEKDWRYFKSNTFMRHMKMLDVDPNRILNKLPVSLRSVL